jgi:hypothetical protein
MLQHKYIRRRKCLALISALLALTTLAGSADRGPDRYPYDLAATGGPSGWPVFIEDVTFDDHWGMRFGVVEGGFDIIPPTGGKTAVLGHLPVPKTLHARWFSHRNQTFYEIDLALPADLKQRLRKWFRQHPTKDFFHTLVLGFAGDGRVSCGGGRLATPARSTTPAGISTRRS